MKTPQDLDKIYNRLPQEKTELSVEKITLGLITKKSAIELGVRDILKEVQKYERQVDENIKSINKILNGL